MDQESNRRAFLALSGRSLAAGFAGGTLTSACAGGSGNDQTLAGQPDNGTSVDAGSGGTAPMSAAVRDVVAEYDADPTGARDSIASIQEAIDDLWAVGGGTVFFPSGIFSIGAPIRPRDGVSLVGVRPAPLYPQACPDLGIDALNGKGTWLRPTEFGQGISGIEFNVNPLPDFPDPRTQDVPVSNILIASLGFVGFENGIRAGALNHRSFGFGRLQDLMFLGKVDGIVYTDHALNLINFQHTRIDHVKVWSCMHGINLQNSHTICSGGNSVVIEPYVYMDNSSVANSGRYGLRLGVDGTGSAELNAVTIIRPQVNWFLGSAPGMGKTNIAIEGNSAPVVQCDITGIDVEGGTDAHIAVRNAANMLLGIAVVAGLHGQTENILLDGGSGVVISHTPNAVVHAINRPTSRSWSLFGLCNHVRGFGIRGQYHEIVGPDASHPDPATVVTIGSTDGSADIRIRGRDRDGLPRVEGRMLQTMPTVSLTSAGQASNYAGHRLLCAFDNQDVFLKAATDLMTDSEYLFVKTHPGTVGVRIRPSTGDTLSGSSLVTLVEPWSFVRLYCTGQGAWIVLESRGIAVA